MSTGYKEVNWKDCCWKEIAKTILKSKDLQHNLADISSSVKTYIASITVMSVQHSVWHNTIARVKWP